MLTVFGVGNAAAAENDLLVLPNTYQSGRMGIVFCHNLGGSALSPAIDPNMPNFFRILSTLVDVYGFPVVFTDLGGQLWNNDTVMTRVGQAIAWLQSASGGRARSGKVGLLCWSMGGTSAVRYAALNPSNVSALVGLQPVSDINDLRNFNRPNGWTGTTPNAPLNGRSANLALGLAQDSTADYPTHGTSLATLAATNDPTLTYPTGIPAAAWYSSDDTSAIPATITALWGTKMGGTVRDAGTGGHGDGGLAGVDPVVLAKVFAAAS